MNNEIILKVPFVCCITSVVNYIVYILLRYNFESAVLLSVSWKFLYCLATIGNATIFRAFFSFANVLHFDIVIVCSS